MKTEPPSPPKDILAADALALRHPRVLVMPKDAPLLWKLTIGNLTFARYREPYVIPKSGLITWARVMREAKYTALTSHPPPRTFWNSLFHHINNESPTP